ncbi:MAG TPA: adenylate/guanylate cyclase domain-containing protein [Stellaceae bacterium]|nr:adenylate/guanylate cyclase domain-containing protein [Stellaceae bacterium]
MPQPEVQRKLAAILAADVAGYSRLTGADEEGTIARLRALRRELIDPTIEAHHGRIVKTTGDGILIEFASVVDGVRCAVEVQREMASRNSDIPPGKRLEFRIGIHLGDVVVDGDDLLGDGVNVAARIERLSEPGAICVSEDAYRHVCDKAPLKFIDIGERVLKNIARPMRVYAVPAATERSIPRAHVSSADTRRLSIVVLPFTNLSGDKEQDYFVDGITESLTTDLSRISGAFVIARNTAFTYKGKSVDARQIGRELGVRYLMEGSVQSGRDRIRINAQLIDTETGAHLWAERFDKPRADLFDMQDEITSRLAHAIGIELVAAETQRAARERSNDMDAVDLEMRGRAIWKKPFSLARAREARKFFEAALRLDDRMVDALVGLAATHIDEVINIGSDSPQEQIRLAEEALSKALTLAPNNANAHYYQARTWHALAAPERAIRECELAIRLDSNHAWAHAYVGAMKILLGRAEETEADVAAAIRLSPRDPGLGTWFLILGMADLALGRLSEAVDRLRKSVEINPHRWVAFLYLAAALVMLGRGSEAAEACATGRRLVPDMTINKFRTGALSSRHPVYVAHMERTFQAMRKAGLPEE